MYTVWSHVSFFSKGGNIHQISVCMCEVETGVAFRRGNRVRDPTIVYSFVFFELNTRHAI